MYAQLVGSEPPVRLLDVEPDLIRHLNADHRAQARTMLFPVRLASRGDVDVRRLFEETNSFGGLLLDGILVQRQQLGGHFGVRLLGPGDIVPMANLARSTVVSETIYRAAVPTRIALFGYDLLAATHRWPMLIPGLQARNAEQAERIVTQLMICQLPRVDERVLALLWLLADTWGPVTSQGPLLRLTLTHELLGLLVGAKRPTVSLALRQLTERGALLRQDTGWLLLERPVPSERPGRLDDPHAIIEHGPDWSAGAMPLPLDPDRVAQLRRLDHEASIQSFERRREDHDTRIATMHARVAELRAIRERAREERRRIVEASVRRRSAPSS